jgi:type II secretory pathway pseudopilin PulG
MLIAVMFMLALVVIALSVAAPKIAKQIQRDRELETMHRGKQYVRAVKMYYKKFGAYPPNIDALVKTNQIRFLRKKYIDPTTGKDEWKIIHFGENKTQTMGFFGQPIGGSTIAGIGPSGGNGLNGSPGMTGGFNGTGGPGSVNGTSTDPGTNPTGTNGTPPGSTDPNAPGTGTGLNGQTFGGGGIIGVSPGSPKQSILVYKKKNHYNEWEFFYDPLVEQMMMQGGIPGSNGLNPNPAGGPSGPGVNPTGTLPVPTTPTPPAPSQ